MILGEFLKVRTQPFCSKKIRCRHLTGGNLIYNQLKNNQSVKDSVKTPLAKTEEAPAGRTRRRRSAVSN